MKIAVTAGAIALILLGIAACQSGGYIPGEWVTECDAPSIDAHPAAMDATASIERALEEDRGAGISALVMLDGKVVWQQAVGLANADSALTPLTSMRIGSVSKPLTASLVARLIDNGQLSPDDPVQQYVPEFPHPEITVSQLVHHTSGLRQYDFSSFSDGNNTTGYPSLSAAFARHLAEPLIAEPGTGFNYSSIGYNLLGILVERVHGTTYEVALQELLLDPLELQDSHVDDPESRLPCRADFHSVMFGLIRMPTIWRDNSDLYPSGGLLSTPHDLARIADATLAGSFFSPATRQLTIEPAMLADGSILPYGFGWELDKSDQGEINWIGHGGTINGAYASLRYYPCNRMVVAGIANYNLFLTSKRATFFHALREEIPSLFGTADCATSDTNLH